jgi:hypothetical protein
VRVAASAFDLANCISKQHFAIPVLDVYHLFTFGQVRFTLLFLSPSGSYLT